MDVEQRNIWPTCYSPWGTKIHPKIRRWKCIWVWNHGCQAFPVRGYRWQSPNLRLRPFGMGLNWFPKSICVSEASPTACDFHSRPTGFPKRSLQNQFQTECKVCLAGLPLGGPLNSKPHNISKVSGGCWAKEYLANMLQPMRNQNPSKNQEVEMHLGLKSWLPSFPGERLSLTVPKS